MQTFYNSDSRNHVMLLWSMGGSAFSLLWVGEPFSWGKLLIFSVHATDFAYIGVLEESHEFVSYLCHCFSLNILSWTAYLLRVITINVWLLAQSFIGLMCFHVIFFLSLIMSTFIKNYNHSIHISFWTHIFQEIFALELYLVASVFYLPNSTVLHFSNRRAFIFFSLSLYIHPSIPLPS